MQRQISSTEAERRYQRWSSASALRFGWTVATAFVVESLIFGLSVLPAALFFDAHLRVAAAPQWLRFLFLGMAMIPTYFIFAVSLMALSALAMRVLGWRPPQNAKMPIAELGWPICNWARYGISIHLVRIFAGTFLRTTPLWTWYMRMNGARLGRRVWINSLDVTDHCLLDFGDDVVVGAGVHLSGHTVERGVVRTAPVRLGSGTTVGVNSHIEIGVETGSGCQIGSLSMVPKGARLEGRAVYVGCPVHKLEPGHATAAGHS
jgi:acetyltransferase-like isoleucine patch superfamily enzyme